MDFFFCVHMREFSILHMTPIYLFVLQIVMFYIASMFVGDSRFQVTNALWFLSSDVGDQLLHAVSLVSTITVGPSHGDSTAE